MSRDQVVNLSDRDGSYKIGNLLSTPSPSEQVVISGIAGSLPMSENIEEFKKNLFDKVDMITKSRWADTADDPNAPKDSGLVQHVEKFDSGFFGIHHQCAHFMDPSMRIVLERTVECIFDAGIHPTDLKSSRTGVFAAICKLDTKWDIWKEEFIKNKSHVLNGVAHSVLAHRITYFLQLKGPSVALDSACSSSLFALEHAYKSIQLGECDNAIVVGTNIVLNQNVTTQFVKLGAVSSVGRCKPFDKDSDGYVRSEGVCAFLLQKAKVAKRIYARIVHCKTNNDGYKEEGITYPSRHSLRRLLREFYEECNVDPSDVSYIEAHGTGTAVGDPEECAALDMIFGQKKNSSALVGSVKSNAGHGEAVSGLVSVIKCIIAMESEEIPPTLHFNEAGNAIPSIKEGRLEVVTNNKTLRDTKGLLALNGFGFGGSNCHVLLKWHSKQKFDAVPQDDLPRLVCISGRTKEAVTTFLKDISHMKLDYEYIGLLHEAFSKSTANHLYRGFVIVSKSGEVTRSLTSFNGNLPILCILFSRLQNWNIIIKNFLQVPLFYKSFKRIQAILSTDGIDIDEVLENPTTNSVLGNVIAQVCIADVIKALKIQPCVTADYSFGNLIHNYYEGKMTLEGTINCARVMDKEFTIKNGKITEEDSRLLIKKFKNVCITRSWKNSECYNPPSNSVIWKLGTHQVKELLTGKADTKWLSFGDSENNVHFITFLQILGRLYEMGYNPQVANLYPKVEFPVSKDTPMISPRIKWNHNRDWFVMKLKTKTTRGLAKFAIRLGNKDWSFLSGYIVDDKNLFPVSGYLYLVWEVLANMNMISKDAMDIIFENCQFLRPTTIPSSGELNLEVMILTGSGYFEVTDGETPLVTGKVSPSSNIQVEFVKMADCTFTTNEKPLQSKDIYKEFRLRGYNYSGAFKGIQEYHFETSKGLINWEGNWVVFLDSILQTKFVHMDTRQLHVPISINMLAISGTRHRKFLNKSAQRIGDSTNIPFQYYEAADIIKCGGVEVRGFQINSMRRKKDLRIPVLEKYEFVPNNANLSVDQSVRVNIQIILENLLVYKLNTAEVIEFQPEPSYVFLSPIIERVLQDQLMVTPNTTILSKERVNISLPFEYTTVIPDGNYTLLILSDVFNKPQRLSEALHSVATNGYILARESPDFDVSRVTRSDIIIQTVHRAPTETLILLARTLKPKTTVRVKIDESDEFLWLNEVQNAIKSEHHVLLYTENEPFVGITGFVNCLRREPGLSTVKCIFLMDQTKRYDPCDNIYICQLKKNMAMNVYKDGEWGTYRHLLLDHSAEVKVEHAIVNILEQGNLASLRWVEGPLNYESNYLADHQEKQLVKIYYASLNFRDITIATGKINRDGVNRFNEECALGFEFAGRTESGCRVMGVATNGAISTMITADKSNLMDIPDEWSMEDGATVMVVYRTVIYALLIRGELKNGESILIHSGTGGIGQAAIRIALHYGCTIFTTVGTHAKKEFLKKMYPQLLDCNIGNSHDSSFEQMVQKQTKGRGVDMVLNSLSEEKLLASVRCLASGGRFLEIRKFDLYSNTQLNLLLLEKKCSFHVITINHLFNIKPKETSTVCSLMKDFIAKAVIKPLERLSFSRDEVEKSFCFMAKGKHTGKILIAIKKEENEKISMLKQDQVTALPRYYCSHDKSYIILGGLGGFGLELVDWLILRGARYVIINSRSGIKTGYQQWRMRIWTSYGISVTISTADVTSENGCLQLIREALLVAPLEGIFNSAVILDDAIFENQTVQKFQNVFAPKVLATKYLDQITRNLCPELRTFVVFSSICGGRGSAGQTNYGMANSVMDRICEKRMEDGFAALSIQWGTIDEVGIIIEMKEEAKVINLGGTLQQSISSCIRVLDIFLRQEHSAVVSSMVVAEKRGKLKSNHIMGHILNILGISDLKGVSPMSSLAKLGMDSMTTIEIKQILEREFEVFLTSKELRSLTLARLQEIGEQNFGTRTDDVRKIDI